MKFGCKFVGTSGRCSQMAPDQVMKQMGQDQIMKVKLDTFAANYAGASPAFGGEEPQGEPLAQRALSCDSHQSEVLEDKEW